jgi:HD-GYP domain-containing protein (c-di-GMP phosphodiesterase class II)
MEKENLGASLFSQNLINDESIEEIFALNLGDFLSEHLISEDLAQKIGERDNFTGVKNQLKELVSIYSLNNTLCVLSIDKKSEKTIYSSIADSIKQMIDVDFCQIYLGDFFTGGGKENSTLVKEAEFERKTVKNAELIAVPMVSSVKNIGVIVIPNKKGLQQEYLNLVESIASLFATSIALQSTIDEANKLIANKDAQIGDLQHIRAELTALIGDLCDYQQSFTRHLALAADTKGQYKVAHSENTAELARKICKQLGLNEKTTDLIYYAGMLQNIGKIALPEKIFASNSTLTDDELRQIRESSNTGINLLMNINFMSEVVPYIIYSTERYDGSGKPEGLKGESIPFGSRIIAAADAFSALTSDRPHRKALEPKEALEILKSETKWDPIVLEALDQAKPGP